jgi:hypothetical protein
MKGISIITREEQNTSSMSCYVSSVNTVLRTERQGYRCSIPGRDRKVFHMYKRLTGRTISLLSSGYCEIFPWGMKLISVLHLVPMLYMYVCMYVCMFVCNCDPWLLETMRQLKWSPQFRTGHWAANHPANRYFKSMRNSSTATSDVVISKDSAHM